MKVGVIIVCAGKGRRFGSADKAIAPLAGKPLFYHTVRAFFDIADIKQIIIVLQTAHIGVAKRFLPDFLQKRYHISFVAGGRERIDSVRNALVLLDKTIDYVLIHDGARPLISKALIRRLIRSLKGSAAVICALQVRDTLKQVDARLRVRHTLKRSRLVSVQTPQGFKKDILLMAYKKYKRRMAFDDSQLAEAMGVRVKVIEGDVRNFKITYPEDMELARALVKNAK